MTSGRLSGETARKIFLKNTNEAGMYMKTNDRMTKCPIKSGH
jgi:hypothetical protein